MTSSAAPDAPRIVTVSRLADYVKRKIDADAQLRRISVRGEISNLGQPRSGHWNFDLKEGDAILRCFAWADDALAFPALKNGTAVVATGAVSTYPAKSSYQLVVRSIELEGIGNVHALFEERKRRLAAEGAFDAARKRRLPAFPFRVALVSSRKANGANDFVTLLRARAPHVAIVWCETLVQGPGAAPEIVAALGRASREDVDLIVLTRGGGSFEDLFVFSDERVVRAVLRAGHPVLSAIGHAADQQLCDFAADAHVETPSKAAETVGRSARDLHETLDDRLRRSRRCVTASVDRLRQRLDGALVRSKLAQPELFLVSRAQRLGDREAELGRAAKTALQARAQSVRELARRLEACRPSRRLAERAALLQKASLSLDGAIRDRLQRARRRAEEAASQLDPAGTRALARLERRLTLLGAHLDGKNPEAILQRGYAIVTHRGAILRDPAGVPAGERVEARLARGTLVARVERKEADGNQRIG